MITVHILFQRQEISLRLNRPPNIILGDDGKIADVAFHNSDLESVRGYLRYCDWTRVEAVVQYDTPDTPGNNRNEKEAPYNGKEAGGG